MSDFLSQFEEGSYKKTEKKSDVKEIVTDIEHEVSKTESAIDAVNHETVIDTKYNKRKIILYISAAVTAIVVTLIIVFGIRIANQVVVTDFVGNNINEARQWALRNRVELEIDFVFDLEFDADIVIEQDKESGTRLQRGGVLSVIVSRGADPDERIELPDFEEMTLVQIQEWMNTNRLRNINIVMEYNTEVERNGFIRLEFRRDTVNETNFTRREAINIYVSRGEEVIQRNILVPNFAERARAEVAEWGTENGVTIIFTEAGSGNVAEGFVISQNVEAGTRISRADSITVVISRGSGIRVPDFSTISKNDAANAAPGLQITVRRQYSATVAFGRLISQSVGRGAVLFGPDASVTVVYSLGRPYVDNLIGKSERDLAPYFYEFSARGANITFSVAHVDSSAERGTVVWASRSADFVAMTDHVYIHISRGNLAVESPE